MGRMTPLNKAHQLITLFGTSIYMNIKGDKVNGKSIEVVAKECALIASGEILNSSITKDNYIFWSDVRRELLAIGRKYS